MGRVEPVSAGQAAVPRVTLYVRPECHLCDEARDDLIAMRAGGLPFELHEVDIESDDDLLRRNLERIPVVEVDGAEVCALVLDAAAVRAALAESARQRSQR